MTANGITQEKTQQIWYGCYDGGWQGLISEQAFSHPAKFSRNLISRIYAYALERGWLKAGDTVLDPFGGVGLGALDAGANGLNYIGVELETRFHDMGQGCDCTGISKADWVRFYGRWDKVAHTGGRHYCPQCLAEAKQVTIDQGQLSFFEPEPTAAYTRNSGIIPETRPHHYTGNLELFRKYAQPGTWAVLLNGDSRNLRAVIGQGMRDGLLSSPPYVNQEVPDWTGKELSNNKDYDRGRPSSARKYGLTTGQLGGMSEGSLADSLVSSPPYADSLVQKTKRPDTESTRRMDELGRPGNGKQVGNIRYGESEGQLSALPTGNLADSLLTSPPFAGNSGGRGEASRNGIDAALFDRHSGGMKKGTGDNPANLDHLPMRGFDAALGSPPFSPIGNNPSGQHQGVRADYRNGKTKADTPLSTYGEKSNGQLGAMPMAGFDASLASPPFADSVGSDDPDKRGGLLKSDPKRRNDRNLSGSYGASEGQLGIETKETFWSAAKMIVSEAYLVLKPGAVTFWVCKSFIRDGAIVDFPGQWQQLCEAVGFEYVETIRAMLVSRENGQGEIDGGVKVLRKEKKSFFRRLAEKNGSPRIDYEEIVVMRKPL